MASPVRGAAQLTHLPAGAECTRACLSRSGGRLMGGRAGGAAFGAKVECRSYGRTMTRCQVP